MSASSGNNNDNVENIEEEKEKVLLALEAVFSPGTSHENRESADKYLTCFQRQRVAWMVCDKILVESNSSGSHHHGPFFAAQTVHTKCRTDVSTQLPPESLPSLRDSLLHQITTYSNNWNTHTPIVTRLCMSLAALAVQMGWTTILQDVIQGFASSQKLVFQIIQYLPEEASSDRLILETEEPRQLFLTNLQKSTDTLLQYLWYHATNSPAEVQGVLQCFASWIRYIHIPPPLLVQHAPLLRWVFFLLAQPTNTDNLVMESCVDVVVELFRLYPSEQDENKELVHTLIPLAMSLEAPFFQQKEDEEIMRMYCRIFTEMGESYMSLVVSPEKLNQEALVGLVLHCSSIPDTDIAHITLHFWYKFVSWLESLEPDEYRQHIVDNYTPQLLQLVSPICIQLMKYPNHDLMDDEDEELLKYRLAVCDTLDDCCRLLGGDIVLQQLGKYFQSLQQQQQQEWQLIEACLYALGAISRFIPSDEGTVLPPIMSILPNLPEQLQSTVNYIIGKYATWLHQHPQTLEPILQYLAQGLSPGKSESVVSSSAIAIKELCDCNSHFLGDAVLQLYDSIIAAAVLPIRDELQVLEGACKAVSKHLFEVKNSESIVSSYVTRIVQPIGLRLTNIAKAENNISVKTAYAELDRLTVVVRFLHIPHVSNTNSSLSGRSSFLLDLIQESWPLLEAISQKYAMDVNVAEKMCRLHKHTLRGCGVGPFEPLLQPLVTHLVRNYAASHLSPYLYASSICITEYGQNEQYTALLLNMLTEMSNVTFGFIRTLPDFVNHPDVVEEFFFLAGRMMTYCPVPLVVQSPSLLHSLVQCAIVGIELDHKDGNRGILNFLDNLMSYAVNNKTQVPSLNATIQSEGSSLVNNLLQALIGNLPAYRVDNSNGSIASVLYKLHKHCPSLLQQWMGPILSSLPQHISKPFILIFTSPTSFRDDVYRAVRKLFMDCERSRKRNI